jgi:glycosyltransferase involved in cell wall biosynthesis
MSTPTLSILAPLKNWGGIERKLLILCSEFSALGVDVELVLLRGGQIPYPDQFPQKVKIVDLKSGGKLSSIIKLIGYLRGKRPNALLTAKDHAAKSAVLATRLSGTHVPVYHKVTNTLSLTLRRPAKRLFARLLYPWAKKVIANSNGVKDDLVTSFGMSPETIEVVYNPVLTPDISQRLEKAPEHAWLTEKDVPVIMGVGRLASSKDFITLIEAFAQLRQYRSCRLIILGEGPERERIESRVREVGLQADVDLPGYISDPLPWMAHSDVFVLSSRYEGLSNVLIEALAAGTPVVSTNCPSGSAEILQNGRLGPLVPVGDSEAMAEAVGSVLDHPLAPEQLREGLERFQSDQVARQYLHVMGLVENKA